MKRTTILVTLILLFGLSSVFAEDITLQEEKAIRIGGDNYFPPFEYVDANGHYKGFNVDITLAVALETGLNIEFHPMAWSDVTNALNQGTIEVAQGMKHSKEREKRYSFSDPYVETSLSIFVKKNSATIISLEDLKNKRIAIQKDDIANNLIEPWMQATVIETENQTDALELLINGQVDAYIGNRLVGLYSIQKQGYQNLVKMTGGMMNAEKYGFAMNKDNVALIDDFNEGLAIIKKNGTYDKIYAKWFGDEIKPPIEYFKSILLMIGMIILIVGLVFAFVLHLNMHLKKEVAKQTAKLKSETLYKAQIIDSIFSGLVTIDKGLVVKSVNRKANEILHVASEELLGQTLKTSDILSFIHRESFQEVSDAKSAKIDVEGKCQIHGSEKIMEYNIYPLLNNQGDLEGWTLTFRDVTFARQLLRKAMRNDKLESLGRLTAGIAHEIRNPLASIRAYLDILPEKYDDERYRNRISVDIPEVIDQLNESINSLLEFAKPRVSYPTYFKISEVIESSYKLMSKEFEKEAIEVWLKLDYNDGVYMDKHHLQQVILNLLINAMDAVKETEKPLISIESSGDGEHSIFKVINNGQKIPEDKMEIIFEPFYTTKHHGTGLGLSISHQLINQNGGDIKVVSTSAGGAVFKVILPFVEEDI